MWSTRTVVPPVRRRSSRSAGVVHVLGEQRVVGGRPLGVREPSGDLGDPVGEREDLEVADLHEADATWLPTMSSPWSRAVRTTGTTRRPTWMPSPSTSRCSTGWRPPSGLAPDARSALYGMAHLPGGRARLYVGMAARPVLLRLVPGRDGCPSATPAGHRRHRAVPPRRPRGHPGEGHGARALRTERALVALAIHSQQLDERLARMERRLARAGIDERDLDLPTQGRPGSRCGHHSARVSAELTTGARGARGPASTTWP